LFPPLWVVGVIHPYGLLYPTLWVVVFPFHIKITNANNTEPRRHNAFRIIFGDLQNYFAKKTNNRYNTGPQLRDIFA
jgi:hypothetical protein